MVAKRGKLVAVENVLRSARTVDVGNSCAKDIDPTRFFYKPCSIGGGVGVSFFDPANLNNSYDELDWDDIRRIEAGDKIELEISQYSDDLLEKRLSVASVCPYSGLSETWRRCFLRNGREVEPLLKTWSKKISVSYHEYRYHIVRNDCTNRAFNFLYLSNIVYERGLLESVAQYRYFSDGERVSRQYGYDSPAYALALALSLRNHGLLDFAMMSYDNFLRYHPVDPITAMCERAAMRRFRNISCDIDGDDPSRIVYDYSHSNDDDYEWEIEYTLHNECGPSCNWPD